MAFVFKASQMGSASARAGFATVVLSASAMAGIAIPPQDPEPAVGGAVRASHVGSSRAFPVLRTDREKLSYLVYAQEHIPELFKSAAAYQFDLFEILDQQSALNEKLAAQPEFAARLSRPSSLLSSHIEYAGDAMIKSFSLSPSAVADWKSSLLAGLREWNTGSFQNHLDAVEKRLKKGGSSKGMMTGLFQTLSDAEKQTFQTLPETERLGYLKTRFPETMPASFRGEAYGLSPLSRAEDVFRVYEELAALEQEGLPRLRALRVLIAKLSPGADLKKLMPGTPEYRDLVRKVEGIDDRTLLWSADIDHYREDRFAKSIQAYGQRFASRVEANVSSLRGSISLIEVPPGLAIFRGLIGGDCSSSCSFAFPNDPNERVFFIRAKNGELKGYLSGTIVETNGKRAFYAMTVAGRTMTSAETHLAFRGLIDMKAQLGVESIVVPAHDRLAALINTPEVAGVYQGLIAEGKPVSIQYRDVELRRIIEGFPSRYNSSLYDGMAVNRSGFEIDEAGLKKRLPGVISKTTLTPQAFRYAPKSIDQLDAFLYGLDLKASHRDMELQRLLHSSGIGVGTFNESAAKVRNQAKRNWMEYKREVIAVFSELAPGEKPMVSKRFEALLSKGWIHAPDALSRGSFPETQKYLATRMNAFEALAKKSGIFTAREAHKAFLRTVFDQFSGIPVESLVWPAALATLAETAKSADSTWKPTKEAIEAIAERLLFHPIDFTKSNVSIQNLYSEIFSRIDWKSWKAGKKLPAWVYKLRFDGNVPADLLARMHAQDPGMFRKWMSQATLPEIDAIYRSGVRSRLGQNELPKLYSRHYQKWEKTMLKTGARAVPGWMPEEIELIPAQYRPKESWNAYARRLATLGPTDPRALALIDRFLKDEAIPASLLDAVKTHLTQTPTFTLAANELGIPEKQRRLLSLWLREAGRNPGYLKSLDTSDTFLSEAWARIAQGGRFGEAGELYASQLEFLGKLKAKKIAVATSAELKSWKDVDDSIQLAREKRLSQYLREPGSYSEQEIKKFLEVTYPDGAPVNPKVFSELPTLDAPRNWRLAYGLRVERELAKVAALPVNHPLRISVVERIIFATLKPSQTDLIIRALKTLDLEAGAVAEMHKILLPDSRVKVSPVEVLSKLRTFKVDSVARMTLIRRTYSLVPEGPIWQYAIDKDWLSDPEFLRKRVLPFLEIPLSHEHDLFGRRIRVYREEIYPGIPEELRARMPTPERILSDRLDEFVRYMSDPRHSRVSPSAVGWQELSRLYPDPRSQLKILNAFRLNGASLSELKRLPFDNGGFFEFLGNRTRRMQFYSALDEADRVAVQEIFSFAQKNADAPGFRSEVQAWLVELKKSRGLAGSLRAKAIPCGLEGMSNQVHGLIAP